MTDIFSIEGFTSIFTPVGLTALDPTVKDSHTLYREMEKDKIERYFSERNDKSMLISGQSGYGKSSSIRTVSEGVIRKYGGKFFDYSHVLSAAGENQIYIYYVPLLGSVESIPRHVMKFKKGIEDYDEGKQRVIIIDQIDMYLKRDQTLQNIFDNLRNNFKNTNIIGVSIEKLKGFDETLKFGPYDEEQVIKILEYKSGKAIQQNLLDYDVLLNCSHITSEDFCSSISNGMCLLASSAKIARSQKSQNVNLNHLEEAFKRKIQSNKDEVVKTLPEEWKIVLRSMNNLYSNNSHMEFHPSDVFDEYIKKGGSLNSVEICEIAREIDRQGLHEGCKIVRENGSVRKVSPFFFKSEEMLNSSVHGESAHNGINA